MDIYQEINKIFENAMESYPVYANNSRYYIEFEYFTGDSPYILQSKWFKTKDEAKSWYRESFDFVDTDNVEVRLMEAPYDKDGYMGDIKTVEHITNLYLTRRN